MGAAQGGMVQGKWFSLTILAICEVASLGLWLSATVVIPVLREEFDITGWQASLFTSSVQAGFVVGALVSALLSLADRFDPRRLFMISTLIACGGNALILLVEPTSLAMPVLRFITGMCMAGIYPTDPCRLWPSWSGP